MLRELLPTALEWDCGHPSYFFANPFQEMKAISHQKRVHWEKPGQQRAIVPCRHPR